MDVAERIKRVESKRRTSAGGRVSVIFQAKKRKSFMRKAPVVMDVASRLSKVDPLAASNPPEPARTRKAKPWEVAFGEGGRSDTAVRLAAQPTAAELAGHQALTSFDMYLFRT